MACAEPGCGALVLWAERAGRRRAAGPARGGLRFAFYGRVSTEDWQDPESSRARQREQAGALKRTGAGRDQQSHRIKELEQQLDQLRRSNLYLQVGFFRWTPKWNAQQVAMRFLLVNFLGIIAGACLIGFDVLQELGFGLVVGGFFGASTLLTAVWNQLYENERDLFTSTESDQRASELDSLISQSKKLVAEQQALVDKKRRSTTTALSLRAFPKKAFAIITYTDLEKLP